LHYLFDGVSLQNKRSTNMDSILVKQGRIGSTDALLAVVCDGVGSLQEGGIASGTAIQMLSAWFGKQDQVERIGLSLRDEILEINSYINQKYNFNQIVTASTISALLLVGEAYYIVHAGDSRIYSYDGTQLFLLTNDDTTDSGKLVSFLGRNKHEVFQYYEGNAKNKTFLVCSDGLYKKMEMTFLLDIMKNISTKSLKDAMTALPNYVINHGEKDNISLVIIKYRKLRIG